MIRSPVSISDIYPAPSPRTGDGCARRRRTTVPNSALDRSAEHPGEQAADAVGHGGRVGHEPADVELHGTLERLVVEGAVHADVLVVVDRVEQVVAAVRL